MNNNVTDITVVARLNAKPGRENDFEMALRAAVAPTHAEAECKRYIVHRSLEKPNQFVVVERWASTDSLKAHLASEHIQTFFSKFPDLLEGAPEVSTFEALEEGGSPKGRW